jgi:hypothetical protein
MSARRGINVTSRSRPRGTDYHEGVAPTKVPIIGHEIGQFCAYPNFSEIGKYTGASKPGNLMIFRDFASAARMSRRDGWSALCMGTSPFESVLAGHVESHVSGESELI